LGAGITDAGYNVGRASFVTGIGDPGCGDKKRLASKEAAVNSAALDHTHDQYISQTSKMAHDCDHRSGDHFVLLVFR
jgi:hypothetical protein